MYYNNVCCYKFACTSVICAFNKYSVAYTILYVEDKVTILKTVYSVGEYADYQCHRSNKNVMFYAFVHKL